MPSSTALLSGLSGLSSNARRLDVIGNNIANVNTAAYKSNRAIFAPASSRSFSLGTAPGAFSGGTNPGQIGMGVGVGSTQRNFTNGAINATGVSTDLAIEGDGFFIVDQGDQRAYTRSGAFQRNEQNELVNVTGSRVLGYGVDAQFNIDRSALGPLEIPVGTLTLAEATRNVTMSGNLNASGPLSTTGSVHETRAFFTDAGLTTQINTTAYDLSVPGNDLYISDGAGGSFLAFEGGANAIVEIAGVEKGGKDLGSVRFAFADAGTAAGLDVDASGLTFADFMTFLDGYLGVDDTAVPPSNAQLGGSVTLDGSTGQLIITGNEGTAQNLALDTADFVVTYPGPTSGSPINQPLVMSRTASADGESARTSFVVYDSLGTPLTVDVTLVLQETVAGEGTVWEWIAESNDNDANDRVLGIGVVTMDANGRFVDNTNQNFSLTRANGAVSPLTVTLDLNSGADAVTALTDTSSGVASIYQDGSPIGTLVGFSLGEDGVIEGAFSNGLNRSLGQVALAAFTNPEGLVDAGEGHFMVGANSGAPIITEPLGFGTGRVLSGALEGSNIDLSQEFISMILASTGYSASSRVINTTNELIDELLILGR